jgi:hypothetical protein
MSRTLRILTCLMGLSLLAGCTVTEPTFKADLGGYAMIHEDAAQTVAARRSDEDNRPSNS